MTQALQQILYQKTDKPSHCIIWMHGLGATADDFLNFIPYLNLKDSTRLVFPQAPNRAITINQGMMMPAWYDIYDFNLRDADFDGISKSKQQIDLIYKTQLADGILAKDIYFAGFSQGGVMAFELGLNCVCGGILALSTYLANQASILEKVQSLHKDKNILQMHGTADPIVPYALGKKAYDFLNDLGFKISWQEYAMGHEICVEQIADIRKFLQTQGL